MDSIRKYLSGNRPRARSDNLQCLSANYEHILIKSARRCGVFWLKILCLSENCIQQKIQNLGLKTPILRNSWAKLKF